MADADRSRTAVVPRLPTSVTRGLHADELRLHADLGKITRFWANLHEHLASVLGKALECDQKIANGMWHTLRSDLVQRNLLEAAIAEKIKVLHEAAQKAAVEKSKQAQVFDEYLWAVREITKHADKRNDLVHSPIYFSLGSDAVSEFEAIVSDHHGNPRAVKLKGRELFQLCGWVIAFISEMHRFLARLGHARGEHDPLPSRPKWAPESSFPSRKEPRRPKPKPPSKAKRPS